MGASSFMTLMVLLMDSLRLSMVLLLRTTVVYFENSMWMLQRSPSRDTGINIAFCFDFLDMISMNNVTCSLKNTGVYKSCTRDDFYSMMEDYYKQHPEEADKMGLKNYRNDGMIDKMTELEAYKTRTKRI